MFLWESGFRRYHDTLFSFTKHNATWNEDATARGMAWIRVMSTSGARADVVDKGEGFHVVFTMQRRSQPCARAVVEASRPHCLISLLRNLKKQNNATFFINYFIQAENTWFLKNIQ